MVSYKEHGSSVGIQEPDYQCPLVPGSLQSVLPRVRACGPLNVRVNPSMTFLRGHGTYAKEEDSLVFFGVKCFGI